MGCAILRMRCVRLLALVVAATFLLAAPVDAQRGGTPPTGRANAALDITGYWVSIVSEDWKFRMVTPSNGMFETIPLNDEGVRIGRLWDPARDEAANEQCKAYGAAGIMRLPGRFHITWENDNTLRIHTDMGTQTRLLHFDPAAAPGLAPTWQGHSVAEWEYAPARGSAPRSGHLKVVTTHMRPGYLRQNGAPYSETAVLTEYYDLHHLPNGDQLLTVTTRVDDPQYLSRPYVLTTDLKKLPDASGWNPTPCASR